MGLVPVFNSEIIKEVIESTNRKSIFLQSCVRVCLTSSSFNNVNNNATPNFYSSEAPLSSLWVVCLLFDNICWLPTTKDENLACFIPPHHTQKDILSFPSSSNMIKFLFSSHKVQYQCSWQRVYAGLGHWFSFVVQVYQRGFQDPFRESIQYKIFSLLY